MKFEFIDSLKNGRNGIPCDCEEMKSPNYLCETSHAGIASLGFSCDHHSNGEYILGNVPSPKSGLSTMFFAGHACRTVDRIHKNDIEGRANQNGSRSISSISGHNRTFWYSVRITQHEWSHNYGARDSFHLPVGHKDKCKSTCVMDGGYFHVAQEVMNVWCVRCGSAINARRQQHS